MPDIPRDPSPLAPESKALIAESIAAAVTGLLPGNNAPAPAADDWAAERAQHMVETLWRPGVGRAAIVVLLAAQFRLIRTEGELSGIDKAEQRMDQVLGKLGYGS